MSTYSEKLQDPRWQKKRLEVLNRDEWECRECGATDKTLHVHHAYYVSGRDPWEYPTETLKTLCKDCHHGDGEESDALIGLTESLISLICEIAPEGLCPDVVIADLGLMIGTAGRIGDTNIRRRLTEPEWLDFYGAVPKLLESLFLRRQELVETSE